MIKINVLLLNMVKIIYLFVSFSECAVSCCCSSGAMIYVVEEVDVSSTVKQQVFQGQASTEILEHFADSLKPSLYSIEFTLQRAQKNPLSVENEKDIIAALEAVKILQDLLNSPLDFATLELTNADFNPNHLFDAVLRIMSHKARGKGLILQKAIEARVPKTLNGDEKLLKHILLNLVGNAIKFTEKGKVTIALKLGSAQEVDNTENNFLRFEVADSGRGIIQEEKEKLFQPYIQANSSIAREYGGTGLGLCFSKHLCELMDGTMGVDSTFGVGSTFWFTAKFNRNFKNVIQHKKAALPDSDILPHFIHELRNPLSALYYSLESMAQTNQLQNQIETARQAAGSMLDLLNARLNNAKGTARIFPTF